MRHAAPCNAIPSNPRARAIQRLHRIEQDELAPLLGLPLDRVLRLAPRLFDPDHPLDERERIVALLAAQLHPAALGWLHCARLEVSADLQALAEVAWERASQRWHALQQGLSLLNRRPR